MTRQSWCERCNGWRTFDDKIGCHGCDESGRAHRDLADTIFGNVSLSDENVTRELVQQVASSRWPSRDGWARLPGEHQGELARYVLGDTKYTVSVWNEHELCAVYYDSWQVGADIVSIESALQLAELYEKTKFRGAMYVERQVFRKKHGLEDS